MSTQFPQIKPLGDKAILIDFEQIIDENLLKTVLNNKEILENELVEDKVEVINTYCSLLIIYSHTIENLYDAVSAIKACINRANIVKNINSKVYHIPVCYDAEFGLDLELISKEKDLKISEIIQLHAAPIYTVYFLGFLPGFLYLGGLDEKLKISRKETPRLKVKKGAVGIGENQTGIYPMTSPGGWQIIGSSPLNLFNKNNIPPCVISPGDKVKFYSISKKEHLDISEEIEEGKFQIITEIYHE